MSSGKKKKGGGGDRLASRNNSWTDSEPLNLKAETDSAATTPPSSSAWSTNSSMMSFSASRIDSFGDDDDDMGGDEGLDQKGLTKKDIHTINEQRRRDVIKNGYDTLSELVPTCRQCPAGTKLSRATKLQRTIDYIVYLQKQSTRQTEELEKLKREVKALEIMKENYEQIARAHEPAASQEAPQVPDNVKFLVFQSIADQLFQSFNSSISVTSFDTLSSCIISWLEEYCKPQALRVLVIRNLQRVNALPPVYTAPAQSQPHPSQSQPHPSQTQHVQLSLEQNVFGGQS